MEDINKERWSRSVALEHDYVHQVYERIGRDLEQAVDPLQNTIRKFLNDLEPGSLVADIGCGDGRHLQERDGLFCLGTDSSALQATLAVQRCQQAFVGNTLQLPLRTSAFDAVLSVGVLHHLASRERRIQALKELARILQVGGRVLIAVRSHERSQDVLMPWYDVKKKGERCQDEDSGEYDLETSDCDSLSLSPSDEDEPSIESAADKFVHAISPTNGQEGRIREQKSRSLNGEDSCQEVRTNVFNDLVQNVLKRFSSDGSMETSHQWTGPDSGKDCKWDQDAFSLPMSVQELVRDNYIELRNIDEARAREDPLKKAEPTRRRSFTDVFKNLWTSKSRSDLDPSMPPMKRSVTTATCNSMFHTLLPLESIGEFDMTISEADKIVNDFLDSSLSDGQDIQLQLPRSDDSSVVNESTLSQTFISKCTDSNSLRLSCANKYSVTNGDKSQCHKNLNLPQKSHTDIHDSPVDQELSDAFLKSKYIFEKPDFSKEKSSEHFENRSGINELSHSNGKQINFLPSLEGKYHFSDITHRCDLSKELNSEMDLTMKDYKPKAAHCKEAVKNNSKSSNNLNKPNECLRNSKYYELENSWEDKCILKPEENKISEDIREKVAFLQKQNRNSRGFSEFHAAVNAANEQKLICEDYTEQKRTSKSMNIFDENFINENGNLADYSIFYSMPELHNVSGLDKLCSAFSSIESRADQIVLESFRKNEKSGEMLETLKSKLSNIDNRISKRYRYPLHRSLTAVPQQMNLSFKNERFTNGVSNNDFEHFPNIKQLSDTSSSAYIETPKKAFRSPFKRSQTFDRLNYCSPATKTASECETVEFGDGDIPTHTSDSLYGHKENCRLDNKLADLNQTKSSLENGDKYHSNKNLRTFLLSSASLQCSCLDSTQKVHSSGTLPETSTERGSPYRSDCIDSRIQCLNERPDRNLNFEDKCKAKGRNLRINENLTRPEENGVSYPDSLAKTQELSGNSFLKRDACQNLDSSRKANQCISERNSEGLSGFNELTDFKEDRTNELLQPETQPLVVNYSYGRIHENGATVVMHRYFHLFEKDELPVLIEKHVSDLHILEYFQYQSHWCVIAEKVRVWTI